MGSPYYSSCPCLGFSILRVVSSPFAHGVHEIEKSVEPLRREEHIPGHFLRSVKWSLIGAISCIVYGNEEILKLFHPNLFERSIVEASPEFVTLRQNEQITFVDSQKYSGHSAYLAKTSARQSRSFEVGCPRFLHFLTHWSSDLEASASLLLA